MGMKYVHVLVAGIFLEDWAVISAVEQYMYTIFMVFCKHLFGGQNHMIWSPEKRVPNKRTICFISQMVYKF